MTPKTFKVSEQTARKLRGLMSATGGPRDSAPAGGGVRMTGFVTVTGEADEDGFYPGFVEHYNATDEAWTEYAEVLVIGANGESLTVDTRYGGVRYGKTDGGDTVFVVWVGGGAFDLVRCDSYPDDAGTPVALPVANQDGMGVVLIPAGDGTYTDGPEVVLRLLPGSGTEFAVGHVYTAHRNGTETIVEGETETTYPLYFSQGNTPYTTQRRVAGVGGCEIVCQRWSIPAPWSITDLPECPEE